MHLARLLRVAGVAFEAQPPSGPAMIGVDLAALVLGVIAGWWRGRFTRIAVDPATHAVTSRTSVMGMLLILALFVLRYGLRAFGTETAGMLHVSAVEITDALMLLAVGLVCAQRLEIALRATRLLRQTRAQP